jgi:hypothetical protein
MRGLLLLLGVLALTGCGQQATDTAEFEGSEAAVAAQVAELRDAGERRDAARICSDILSREFVEAIEEGDRSCSQELERSLREADDHALEVEEVTVLPGRATARVTGQEGEAERSTTFEFVDEDDEWRLDSVGAE